VPSAAPAETHIEVAADRGPRPALTIPRSPIRPDETLLRPSRMISPVNDHHGWRHLRGAALARMIGRVLASSFFRWVCFAAMILLALHGESRPAPRVPDLAIDNIPYVEIVGNYNYWFWLAAYGSMGIALLAVSPARFCRFMVTGGILSLIRGVCILFTGLGPLRGEDVNAVRLAEPGMLMTAFFELIDPTGVLIRRSAFLGHIHYTIDVIGAWAITFTVFALREWRPKPIAG